MAVRRNGKSYIWVTWLSKLLVGEQSCEWSPWFRSHHEGRSWDRAVRPADQGMPTLAEWQMKHTAGIVDTRESLENQDFTVFTENQNAFRLTGQTAVLAGKPDLIALNSATGRILDVKAGKSSPSHIAQVLIYMYAVPKGLPQYRGSVSMGRWCTPTTWWRYLLRGRRAVRCQPCGVDTPGRGGCPSPPGAEFSRVRDVRHPGG